MSSHLLRSGTEVAVGDRLPPVTAPPISRATLALFGVSSGDHNPIHLDIDFARASGYDDVFAHGMLPMGYLGRAVVEWFGQEAMRELAGRFVRITPVGHRPTCRGEVVEVSDVEGERRARLVLRVEGRDGEPTIVGHAVVAV